MASMPIDAVKHAQLSMESQALLKMGGVFSAIVLKFGMPRVDHQISS